MPDSRECKHDRADGRTIRPLTRARPQTVTEPVQNPPPASPRLGGIDAADLLDALPAHAALLDSRGDIIAVNTPWRSFAQANGLPHEAAGLGLNYIETCETATGPCAEESTQVARGVRAVLAGDLPLFNLDYPCHSPDEERWFRVSVSAFALPSGRGALVQHSAITDHVRSRVAASEGEARYRAMFERNALPMWVYDPHTLDFLAVNLAAIEHYGYSREEFLEMSLADIRPASEMPSLLADIADARLRPEHQPVRTWRHLTKTGREILVDIHAHQIPWGGREVRLVTAEDVTERRAAEHALLESEQRFRQITDCISEVFWLTEDQRLLYISPGYETIWGRSRESLDLDADQWFATIHPEDRDRVAAAVQLQASGGYDIEYRIVRPDGSLRWIADRAFPVPRPPGEEAGPQRMAGVARDITQERGNQGRLQLLETAVSRINDIVLITEAEPIGEPGPRIVFVNDAFERRTGYTREEVIGRTPRILQGPATQRSELDRIGVALRTWQPVRAELINYTKAGVPFWLELEIVPIANGEGWFTHWVAIERDITERKELEQQVQQSQRLEALGQLTGGVAHDFNNLLTVMLGNAELLAEQLPAGSLHQRLAQMIGGAAQRGADLTQRLLAFARRQALEPRAVDLERLLDGMDGLLRRTLGEQIEIRRSSGDSLWPTLVDPTQLENALLNLAINARDAMPRGGQLSIEAMNARLDTAYTAPHEGLEPGDYVMLAVSDTGSGIPPELVQRVFEPFFTTKERGKGTGLGLAMVYGFVKQSRGHVALYSEPGQGTTVRIYLPRHHTGVPAAPEPEETEVPSGQGQLVLLVEDDNPVREFARGQLEALRYGVLEATNGPEALALLRERPDIELLFTDVVMPGGMSGVELAEAALALRPGLPVLYTSGYTETALIHNGRLDPHVLLLGKPYRRAELAHKLREALSHNSNRKAVQG